MPIQSVGFRPRKPDAWERVAQAVQIAGGLASTVKNVSDISSNIEQGKKIEAENARKQSLHDQRNDPNSNVSLFTKEIFDQAGVQFPDTDKPFTAQMAIDTFGSEDALKEFLRRQTHKEILTHERFGEMDIDPTTGKLTVRAKPLNPLEEARKKALEDAETRKRDKERLKYDPKSPQSRSARDLIEKMTGRKMDPYTSMEQIETDPLLMKMYEEGLRTYGAKQREAQKPKGVGTPKPFKEDQYKSATFAERMVNAHKGFDELVKSGFNPSSLSSSIQGMSPIERLKSGDVKSYQQFKRDFVTANLRKESGASIPTPERIEEENKYFPQDGDPPNVIAQKQKSREIAIDGMIREAGGATTVKRPKGSGISGPKSKPGGAPQPQGNRPEKMIQMISPNGKLGAVPESRVQDAMSKGFKVK